MRHWSCSFDLRGRFDFRRGLMGRRVIIMLIIAKQ